MRAAEATPPESGAAGIARPADEPRAAPAPLRNRPRQIEQEKVSYLRRPQPKVGRKPRLTKWLKPLAAAVAVLGLPAAVLAWLFASPSFTLRELTVVIEDGAQRISEARVREALAPLLGKNLLRLSLGEIAALAEEDDWVKAADVSKKLPHGLRVRVIERREAALLRDGEDFYYLDQDGVPITLVEAAIADDAVTDAGGSDAGGPDAALTDAALTDAALTDAAIADKTLAAAVIADDLSGLIVISSASPEVAEPGAAGLRLLRELEEANPEWLTGLTEIRVVGEEDFEVLTDSLPFPLLMRTGTVKDKIRRLQELLPGIKARYGAGAAVDLRFERRIIIQPPSSGAESAGGNT